VDVEVDTRWVGGIADLLRLEDEGAGLAGDEEAKDFG